ncbi:MAG: DNA-methyltransferase [Gammaproteobacteria bacterium]
MKPYYETKLGRAFLGDAEVVMKALPAESVNLIVTSPPFPLTFQKKKPYGTIKIAEFLEWFLGFAREFHRLLRDDGSLVIDIGGVWNKGTPTKSLYQHHLLIALCDQLGFHYAQDFYWYNPGALPAPAEWVNVRRIRVKSAVNLVWWLSKSPWPKANNRHVLRKYSGDMLRLLQRGYRTKERPSGHNITPKFNKNHGGAIPPNLLDFGNNDSNGEYLKRCLEAKLPVHPARFPRGLPEFFIKFCSDLGDTVMDPFAGSNVTGEAAEMLGRYWIAIELVAEYLAGSKFRFEQGSQRNSRRTQRQDPRQGCLALR